MWTIEYYTTEEGSEPVREWLDSDEVGDKTKSNIEAKLQKLSEHGLKLLNTNMLDNISGDDPDFYELRHSRYRIAIYHDKRGDKFVLLHGFLKKGRTEPRHIERARNLLYRYILAQGG